MPSNTTAQALAQLREAARAAREPLVEGTEEILDQVDAVAEEARATLTLPTDGSFPDVENVSELSEDQLRELVAAMQSWRTRLSQGLQQFADDHSMHNTWDGFVSQYGLPGRLRTYMIQQERVVTGPVHQRRTLLINARSPQECEQLARAAGQTVSTSSRAPVRLYDDWSFQMLGNITDPGEPEVTTLAPRLYQ